MRWENAHAENLITSKRKKIFFLKKMVAHFDRKLVIVETSVKIYLRAIVTLWFLKSYKHLQDTSITENLSSDKSLVLLIVKKKKSLLSKIRHLLRP